MRPSSATLDRRSKVSRETVESDEDLLRRAAGWAGRRAGERELKLFSRLRQWLIEEALPAGGLGPHEQAVLVPRHIADSLLLAQPFPVDAARIIDVGSGVGLPGLPLAILHPDSAVLLVDRSGRRCRLARRGARVLGLDNVEVVEADITHFDVATDIAVSRAAIPPALLRPLLPRLVRPGGVAVLAASTVSKPREDGFETVEVPEGIVGESRWLLVWRP